VNQLHFGDNLDVLRAMPAEHVDLIYLDPPFNSNADYNLLYGTKRGGPSQAQAHAFEDMWQWGPDSQKALEETAQRHLQAGTLLDGLHKVFGDSNIMAYLAMMAIRLVELRRVLKSQGTLYLHCDPTASHYLKALLDTIFGGNCFLSEVIWKRTGTHSSAKRWGPVHDIILFYAKNGNDYVWNRPFAPHSEKHLAAHYRKVTAEGRRYEHGELTGAGIRHGRSGMQWRGFDVTSIGRHWTTTIDRLDELFAHGRIYIPEDGGWPRLVRYVDESKGRAIGDVWDDIPPINMRAHERLGYPTQKPLALLERIVEASSNEGDTVLDPFCGCGTAIEAAQKLKRRWIGIDVTYLAVHVIEGRLKKVFGAAIENSYSVFGRPKDTDDARALAARDWLEFQKWAVFMLGGLPKDRPGPDGGIDGVIRYHRVGIEQPNRAVVSVKGGANTGVDAVHKLKSVVAREKAELGVLVCLDTPTRAMTREALSEGQIGPPSRRVAKLQIVPVDKLFEPHPIELPGMLDPPDLVRTPLRIPPKRSKKYVEGQGELLLPILGEAAGAAYSDKERPNRSIRKIDIEVTRPTRPTRSKP
jgi:DNA modification methylase